MCVCVPRTAEHGRDLVEQVLHCAHRNAALRLVHHAVQNPFHLRAHTHTEMDRIGMEWIGMEWNGMETEWNENKMEIKWNGAQWNGMRAASGDSRDSARRPAPGGFVRLQIDSLMSAQSH